MEVYDMEEEFFDPSSGDLLLTSSESPTEELTSDDLEFNNKKKYQREIIFNKLLPYADKLDDEADALLSDIKSNLGKCIMLRDIKPGCLYWSNMLHKYIILYDLRFTKEDHIVLIKLMYELLIVPNLESSLVSTFALRLYSLLRKEELISPQELQLPWRPLYDLCFNLMAKKPAQVTAHHYPASVKNLLESVVYAAKIYFPVSATQEILDELKPQICPFQSYTMMTTMKALELFLPVQYFTLENHSLGHELWFNEFMKFWEFSSCSAVTWGNSFMHLIADLAYQNIGYIDWEPYIPMMFTRFVQSFNFPVCYKKMKCHSNCRITSYYESIWIASVLGPKSSAQSYLDKFLKTIETYFHPANYGAWLKKLSGLFVNIASTVVTRLHRERYKYGKNSTSWKLRIPESHKLTDEDVDAFVNSMLPIAMIGIFNKRSTQNFYDALYYLAILRPNIVIPSTLEKVYPTLDCDIEPHKLITAMTCMISISYPFVLGSRIPYKEYAFQEGPLHVLPLLFSSLSGIDPNDPSKIFATFRLISTYVTMIPVADCSRSSVEMSEDERLVCEETIRFEDFVLQFMDKVFVWIDSTSVESVRLENNTNGNGKSRSEAMAESTLNRVFSSLLKQASHSIFCSALNKLRTFVMEHVLEVQVAGQLVAVICKVFSNVNSHETMKALFPFLSEKVLDAIGEGDDILKAENLDNHVLYPLCLINRLIFTSGDALLPYMTNIIKLLDKVTQLQSREGNILGCYVLNSVLQSLSLIVAINVDRDLDNPNHPYIKEWGETVKINSTKIKWFIPGENEKEAIEKIFTNFFIPAISKIENFIKTKNSLSRDELQITLRIILNILDGSDSVLPFWDEPLIIKKSYENCREHFNPTTGSTPEIKMPNGTNVRLFLVELMANLQEIILENVEDDTKSLIILQLIWQNLLLGKLRMAVDSSFSFTTNYNIPKKVVENKITGNRGWFPTLISTRVYSQHHIRRMCTSLKYTETHKNILMNIFKLSISRYSKIRIRAQETIRIALGMFPTAYLDLLPEIIEILQRNPTDHHDAFKGVLYLITRRTALFETILVKPDWELVKKLWPALVLSKPSEKPSVILLKESIIDLALENFYTTNIRLEVPESCILTAAKLWEVGLQPMLPIPTNDEIQLGIKTLKEWGDNNSKIYNEILDILLDAVLEKNLHWRHRIMVMNFFYVLICPDEIFPPQVIRFFLESLIHESIEERKIALRLLMIVFKQMKREHPKVKIEVPVDLNDSINLRPGLRKDNAWLQYNYKTRPIDSSTWNQPRFVHKTNVGYYAWPQKLETYAPSSEQPNFDKNSLTPQEREVEQFFLDKENVDKLIKYLSLEDKKGRDKFNNGRLIFFKGLFRNHGNSFLFNFLPHLQKLVADKHESSQRCAAEIICGIIKGSKHWTYEMTEAMWNELIPILRCALNNLTVETINDWALAISNASKDRDPNKIHWLLECLLEESLLGKAEASFIECGRLMILQGALTIQSWRVGELLHRLLLNFENRIEDSPFQNVRDRLASTLVSIFRVSNGFHDFSCNGQSFPEAREFLEKLYPRLQSLIDDESSKLLVPAVEVLSISSQSQTPSQLSHSQVVDQVREKNIRLLKTVCRWMMETVMISNLDIMASFYKIYPILCQLENNNEKDEELSKSCRQTIAVVAQTLTLPEYIPAALEAIRIVSESTFWSSRANCLEFLQVFVFHNMSIILSNEEWIQDIQKIVLKLLEDERLEVREKASQVLGGLLHCKILPNQETLLNEFKKKAESKVGKKKSSISGEEKIRIINATRLRHAGVLGMCAFIHAYPYDIPEHVPPIFECLRYHLNDPEPIPSTIRKTLNDFKRTHCDGWTGLQGLAEKFSEEQFAVFQDLVVPPSYYA